MKMTMLAAALIAGIAATAWAKPISPDDLTRFKVGAATADDVTASLGRPQATAINSDGTRVLTYISTEAHAKAATFIPIVGLFAGGATGKSEALVFTFGSDGLLKASSSSETDIDCHMASCR